MKLCTTYNSFFKKNFVMKHNSYFALYDDVHHAGVVVAVLRHQIWENNLKIEILGKSTVISHYYVIFFCCCNICVRATSNNHYIKYQISKIYLPVTLVIRFLRNSNRVCIEKNYNYIIR